MPADKLSAFSPQTNAGYISEALPKAGLAVKHSHYAIHGLPHDPPPSIRYVLSDILVDLNCGMRIFAI